MSRSWKRSLLVGLTALFAVLIVADVQAGIIFRRRRVWRNNNVSYSTDYGGTYGTAGAGVNAGVAAPGVGVNAAAGGYGPGVGVAVPGVGVNAGPRGAAVTAPGVNVNAGVDGRMRTGANLNAPGANVRAGADANLPGANADANLRVRGQTPDAEVKSGIDAASKPSTPAVPAPAGGVPIP